MISVVHMEPAGLKAQPTTVNVKMASPDLLVTRVSDTHTRTHACMHTHTHLYSMQKMGMPEDGIMYIHTKQNLKFLHAQN